MCHAAGRAALLWLAGAAAPAGGLSLREPGPEQLYQEIPPTNQAQHLRPARQARYRTVDDGQDYERREHSEALNHVSNLLGAFENMSHSKHIWEYAMSHPNAPMLPPGGCLYLPNNMAWISFYGHIEHPYPPLFLEMIANSYYPECNATSLSGMLLPSSCSFSGMEGSKGCFSVSSRGRAAGVQVFETEGHVGLPDKWSQHIHQAGRQKAGVSTKRVRRRVAVAEDGKSAGGACGLSGKLRETPGDSKLVFPTKYIVCRSSDDDWRVTEEMVREQNDWANKAYSGKSPWEARSFDSNAPPQVDMDIQFDLKEVRFVTDPNCARYGFANTSNVYKYNDDPLTSFTIVVIGDDQSGVLGQTEFPQTWDEFSREQMVVVSAAGFRHYATKVNELTGKQTEDEAYDEGDTLVHESGHALGLFHTFEDGCDMGGASDGDLVQDTNPEQLPHYACSASASCGAPDPVHNFMDYSPDVCMVGFTQGQKRRAWCMIENYRPTLFKASLVKKQ